jgi:hypothetical protein
MLWSYVYDDVTYVYDDVTYVIKLLVIDALILPEHILS